MISKDQFLAFLEKHSRAVLSSAGIALVLGTGFAAYSFWQAHRESTAAEAIYKAEANLRKVEQTSLASKAQNIKKLSEGAGATSDKTGAGASEESFATTFLPAVKEIQATIANHAGTRAALVSAMSLSSFLMQKKQTELAGEVMGLPKYEPSRNEILGGLWRMQKALVLIENKKYPEAESLLQDIIKSDDLKLLHGEAWLRIGLAQEAQGQKDRAKETYLRVAKEFSASESGRSANQQLRWMALPETERGAP
jgi:hypothetical protein